MHCCAKVHTADLYEARDKRYKQATTVLFVLWQPVLVGRYIFPGRGGNVSEEIAGVTTGRVHGLTTRALSSLYLA